MQEIKVMFDNNLTLLYSVIMSLWATVYLELWKRYSALLTHRHGFIYSTSFYLVLLEKI